jgi:5'(3')-deoxyribonucleotidase
MTNNQRRAIYIDMDGVVADFNSKASGILGREVGWGVHDITGEEWKLIAQHKNVYRQLPLITESVRMVALCRSFSSKFYVGFLTAVPRQTTMPQAGTDKAEWIKEHFSDVPVHFGPHSKDKRRWCKHLDLLIDDKPENIHEWVDAGGCGILHSGTEKHHYDRTIDNIMLALDADKPTLFS